MSMLKMTFCGPHTSKYIYTLVRETPQSLQKTLRGSFGLNLISEWGRGSHQGKVGMEVAGFQGALSGGFSQMIVPGGG